MRANHVAATAIGWLNRVVVAAVAVFVAHALWRGGAADDAFETVRAMTPRHADTVPAAPAAAAAAAPSLPVRAPLPGDDSLFAAAARRAWTYVEREYQPATGWVNSVAAYPYATLWDVGSSLAALYCAERLGLLEAEEYDRRMARALATLGSARLFDDAAFNKNYSTRTGRIAGRNDRDAGADARGFGWSATDIGRLLVWLRIIARNDPRHAAAAEAVVRRLALTRLVADGYLWGEDLSPRTGRPRRYQEGRLPYEQYAASGFALWGHRAEDALSLHRNARPMRVLGVPVLADARGHDRVTSEPVLLAGIEVGWTPEMAELGVGMLAAQEARWRRTGQVTAVSEDAIPRAPFYFYYYSVAGNGQPFAVDAQTRSGLSGPRWVSTKAAYGWHALLPGEYTLRTVRAVGRAAGPTGWASGVYEGSGAPTGSQNINTAATVLEAALFSARGGRPLLEPDSAAPPASHR